MDGQKQERKISKGWKDIWIDWGKMKDGWKIELKWMNICMDGYKGTERKEEDEEQWINDERKERRLNECMGWLDWMGVQFYRWRDGRQE